MTRAEIAVALAAVLTCSACGSSAEERSWANRRATCSTGVCNDAKERVWFQPTGLLPVGFDWDSSAVGDLLPAVPEEYEPYVTAPPVFARVLQAGPVVDDEQWLVLDAGSNDGILPGMRFMLCASIEAAHVRDVRERRCAAIVLWPTDPIAVGALASTHFRRCP